MAGGGGRLSCGFGLWQIAGLGTFLILVVMGLLHTIEVKLGIAADKKEHGDKDSPARKTSRQEGRCPGPVINSAAHDLERPFSLFCSSSRRRCPLRPDIAAGARARGHPAPAPASGRADTGQPPAASDEVKDPTTGCGVVMMNAEPSLGISWSGACEYDLAQGKGVLQWTKGGVPTDRYEGEMKDGLYEGQGKLTYANKARYEGEFKAGERDGKGTYIFWQRRTPDGGVPRRPTARARAVRVAQWQSLHR